MIAFFRFFVLAMLVLFLSACHKEIPLFNKDIYIGDSAAQALEHKQDAKEVKSSDPKFDKYFCMKKEDMACFIDTYISRSKGWNSQSSCGLQPSSP